MYTKDKTGRQCRARTGREGVTSAEVRLRSQAHSSLTSSARARCVLVCLSSPRKWAVRSRSLTTTVTSWPSSKANLRRGSNQGGESVG